MNRRGFNHGMPGRPGFQRAGVANPMNPENAQLPQQGSPPLSFTATKDSSLLNSDDEKALALEFVKREKARVQTFEKLDSDTASRISYLQNNPLDSARQAMKDKYSEEAKKQLALIRENPQHVPGGLPHRAHMVALYFHVDQVDELGMPYSFRPQGVVQLLKQSEEYAAMTEEEKNDAVCTAYLQDVAKNTSVALEDLRQIGFTHSTLTAIEALVPRPEEDKETYYARIMNEGTVVRAVELARLSYTNLPSRRAQLAGSPAKPVDDEKRNDYARLGRENADVFNMLKASAPSHLTEYAR